MENRDRLDEFLQRKFAEDKPEQRIPFQEEHWLQAQALLDAQASRRWWRRLAWWMSAGLLLVLAGWWWCTGPSGLPEWKGMPSSEPAMAQEAPASGKTTPAPVSETSLPPTRIPAADAPDREPVAGNRTDASAVRPSRVTGEGVGSVANTPTTAVSTLASTTKVKDAAQRTPSVAPAKQPVETSPEAQAPLSPAARTAPNAAVPDPSGLAGAGRTDAGATLSTEEEERRQGSSSDSAILRSSVRASSTILAMLPLPAQRLTATPPSVELPLALVAAAGAPPAERRRPWRWQAGVVAAAASSLGHLEQESSGVGAGLSLRLHKRSTPWSINADLFWRWRSGTLYDPGLGETDQLRYGLGFALDRYEQRVRGTHWLELPLSLHYRRGAVCLEAGAMPSFVLLVKGGEEHIRQTSLAPEATVVEDRNIRLENRYFKSLHGSVFAGVEWAATDRLQLGLRLHYQPGDLRKNPDYGFADRSPVWADFRVRFFYWNKNK